MPLTEAAAAVENGERLTGHGRSALRTAALEIAVSGLAAVDPGVGIKEKVSRRGNDLIIAGRTYGLDRGVHIIGAGKATYRIASMMEKMLGDDLDGGVIIVGPEEASPLGRVDVLEGDHPIPATRSTSAAQAILDYGAYVADGDLVIACFTGGSSALMSAPPPTIRPWAKRHLHELLLSSGLDIVKVNTVRKHVSAVKGGRLAERMAGTDIVNLTVSDVAADVIDCITDPTVQDTTTPADAVRVLRDAELWSQVAPEIQQHLSTNNQQPPDLSGRSITTVLLATGETACAAMVSRSEELGYRPHTVSTTWDGDAVAFGEHLAGLASQSVDTDALNSPPCVHVGCGGETTVKSGAWRAMAGEGGPNQELALAAARSMSGGPPAALLVLDTDGCDGGTCNAGGLVDDTTYAAASAAGHDVAAALRSHRSSRTLEGIGDALVTGPTGTNVNDLFVLVVDRPE